jgi:hypothetical protein
LTRVVGGCANRHICAVTTSRWTAKRARTEAEGRVQAVSIPALVLASLLFVPGCVPDECTIDFVVSGAVDYTYALRSSNTECTVNTTIVPGVPGILSFSANDGTEMQITLREDDLTIGTHYADVVFSSTEGSWVTTGLGFDPDENLGATCLVTITESEIVDWVRDDHRRVSGVMECTGPLTGSGSGGGEDDLYITGVSFSVYAGSLNLPF